MEPTISRLKETRIASVTACVVSVPLDDPTSFSTRMVTARDYMLVRVLSQDGAGGIGFCYAGNVGGKGVTTAVRELLAPVLVSEGPYRVEGLWQEMYQEALLHGRTGSVMPAISALDLALWNRNARTAVLPLYKYLGAFREGTVPSYASGGYYLEDKTPRMLAEEREHYHARTQGLDVQHQFSKLLLDPLGVADKAVRVDLFDGACLGELF
jgi:L-alanine-DL-glutamate epimerase-like enolase superfamily enzyme